MESISNPIDRLTEKIEALEKAIKGKKEKSDWLDSQEVLQLLRISPRTLQNLRDQGKIGFTRIGKKLIYYSRESVERILKQNYQGPFNQ